MRFKSVSREIRPVETYTLKLAMTKVDIAKGLLRKNPQAAYTRLLAAQEIFVQFGKTKEANFVDTLLSQIRS